ncbi:MAG: hypothetical protein R2780_01750 [Crocinitomicaceae bacterium]
MKKKKDKSTGKKGFKKNWNDFWEPGIKHTDGNKKGKISVARAVGKPFSDLGVGVAGGAVGALGGIWTPFVGFALIVGGHLLGDKSGLMRVGGAAMMAYGIAKAQENHAASDANSVNGLGSLSGAKDRLLDFKDNFLKAFFLDKLTKKKSDAEAETDDEQTMGAIDLSSLDAFADLTKQSAYNFELKRAMADELASETESEEPIAVEEDGFEDDELEGFNYSYEEELDLATI